MHRLLIPLLSLCCAAQATDLQLSSQFSVQSRPLVKAELTDLPTGPGRASFGLSTHAASLSYRQSLSLPALGALQGETHLSRPWSGGLRLSGELSASTGPVALSLGGEAFSAPLTEEDPLAAWEADARDLRSRGWNLHLDARTRLSRFWVLHGSGELGAQPSLLTELEWRRAPGNDEETNSTLLRGGVRAGRDVLGLSAGVTYRTEQGLDLSADALVGPQPGLSARLSLPPLGETEVSAYASYEPWRQTSAPLRYGADLHRLFGSGALSVSLRGGTERSGQPGFGAELRYALPLDRNAAP